MKSDEVSEGVFKKGRKDGVTEFQSIGQIAYSFDRPISTTNSHHNLGRFYSNLQGNLPLSKQEFAAKIEEAFEVEKLSFVDVVISLGVSPTTDRRICRPHGIGRYSEQIPRNSPMDGNQ